jgi:hypothetical protein
MFATLSDSWIATANTFTYKRNQELELEIYRDIKAWRFEYGEDVWSVAKYLTSGTFWLQVQTVEFVPAHIGRIMSWFMMPIDYTHEEVRQRLIKLNDVYSLEWDVGDIESILENHYDYIG